MKNLFMLIFILISLSANSQLFNGVLINGDLTSFTAKMKAKGFILKEIFPSGKGASFKGTMAGYTIEAYAFTTPKSKKVYKIDAYLDESTTWTALKNRYEKFVDLFKVKYGTPYGNIEEFENPYFEGDSYELQAVTLEKANFATLWKNTQGLDLIITISKYKQLLLTYKNSINYQLALKEAEELENVSF